jgi:hypothetical protein
MKSYGGVHVEIRILLTSALVGGEWSATRYGCFNPQGNNPQYLFDRRLGEPQSRSGRRGQEKILDPTGTRTPTRGSPARSQSLYRLSYLGTRYMHK